MKGHENNWSSGCSKEKSFQPVKQSAFELPYKVDSSNNFMRYILLFARVMQRDIGFVDVKDAKVKDFVNYAVNI